MKKKIFFIATTVILVFITLVLIFLPNIIKPEEEKILEMFLGEYKVTKGLYNSPMLPPGSSGSTLDFDVSDLVNNKIIVSKERYVSVLNKQDKMNYKEYPIYWDKIENIIKRRENAGVIATYELVKYTPIKYEDVNNYNDIFNYSFINNYEFIVEDFRNIKNGYALIVESDDINTNLYQTNDRYNKKTNLFYIDGKYYFINEDIGYEIEKTHDIGGNMIENK